MVVQRFEPTKLEATLESYRVNMADGQPPSSEEFHKNSDRTPPYIGTCLQLFSKIGKVGKNALR